MNLVKFHKAKAHITYRTKDRTKVPGASTVAKEGQSYEGLLKWASECGEAGLDYKTVRDTAASIGTLAHFLVQCFLRGEEADLSEFSPADVKMAETCFLKFLDFWERENLVPLATELPLVSEEHRYGGTLDLVAIGNNDMVLLDWKSSKAIYTLPHISQLSAYQNLWNEHNSNNPITRRAIVRIGKLDPVNDFEVRWLDSLDKEFNVFRKQLALYQAKKEAGI